MLEVHLQLLCECNSLNCTWVLEVTPEEICEFNAMHPRPVIIANTCEHGPEPTDVLIERREKYSLYKGGDK